MSDEGAGVAGAVAQAGAAEAYLAHHLAFRPVDATFMGEPGHDHRLPDASAGAAAAERAGAARSGRRVSSPSSSYLLFPTRWGSTANGREGAVPSAETPPKRLPLSRAAPPPASPPPPHP